MKYFNPSYWFKLWLLSAPLFNDKTQGINAKSIDNKKIKDWASNNTSLASIENQELTLSNNQTIQLQNDENIKSIKNLETDHFYENFLKTQGWSRDPQIAQHQLQEIQEEHHQFLKKQHEKSKRNKRDFLGIGNWVAGAAKDTGNWIKNAGADTASFLCSAPSQKVNFRKGFGQGIKGCWDNMGAQDNELSMGGGKLDYRPSSDRDNIDEKILETGLKIIGVVGSGGRTSGGWRQKMKREINNHEQHLPIENITNFSTSNITNL